MPFDLMQYVDEEIEESGGGGSFVCQFSIGAGYLVYATGDRASRYFEVSPNTDRDAQKATANELAAKTGVDARGNKKRANFVLTLYLYADSVVNRDETPNWTQAGPGVWGHDIAIWTDAYKKVLYPSIVETLGEEFEPYTKHWGRIDLVDDPYNAKTGKDNKVPQIVHVFDSEDEAREYVVQSGGTTSRQLPSKPDGFDEGTLGTWNVYAEDVLNSFGKGEDGTYFLAAKYGFGANELQTLKEYYDNDNKDEDLPF